MFFFQLLAAMLILITHVVVVGLFPRASCPEPLPFSHLYVCKIIYIYIASYRFHASATAARFESSSLPHVLGVQHELAWWPVVQVET